MVELKVKSIVPFESPSTALPESPPDNCSLANSSKLIRPSLSSARSYFSFSAASYQVEDSETVTDIFKLYSLSSAEDSSPPHAPKSRTADNPIVVKMERFNFFISLHPFFIIDH